MRAWRVSKAKRATDLSGKGAAIEGGRWNDIDVPAVYMGLTPAICCLETFVHATTRPSFPLKITSFTLPDDPELYFEPAPADLPPGWSPFDDVVSDSDEQDQIRVDFDEVLEGDGDFLAGTLRTDDVALAAQLGCDGASGTADISVEWEFDDQVRVRGRRHRDQGIVPL